MIFCYLEQWVAVAELLLELWVEGQLCVTLDKTKWGEGRGAAWTPTANQEYWKFSKLKIRDIIQHAALSVMMK